MTDTEINIVFDDKSLRCSVGDTVASAVTAADEFALRETADGGYRGIFCGMGVCQDCLVTIDGKPSQRACMAVVQDGMQVARNRQRSALAIDALAQPIRDSRDIERVEPQLLVIGGGAAGLTAAAVAAELGADVVLLDERTAAGGQFFKQPKSVSRKPLRLDRQFEDGRRLIDRATSSGATLVPNALVWGAFAGNEMLVSDGAGTRLYHPQRLILATGAYERALPMPGWTLPGVMTTGAAQTLLRGHSVCPGRRILVAGNGPLNAQVAVELSKAGAQVVSLLELAPAFGPKALLPFLRMLGNAPGMTATGVRLLAGLRSGDVPVRSGCGIGAIESADGRLRVRFGRASAEGIDTTESVEVDSVCMGYGFLPSNELSRALGCRHRYDDERAQLLVERRADCQTSVDGVYAIGDCCGLGGAAAAMQEGVIAAISIANDLGLNISDRASRELRRARKRLGRQRGFQSALWSLYAAPYFSCELATVDTPLCRCENVTLQQFDDALSLGYRSLPDIKRFTRLGMGACQGRYCAPLAASRLAERTGLRPDEYSFFAPRAPLKPVSIGEIIAPGAD